MSSYRSVPDHLIVSFQSCCRATRAATSSSAGIASSSIPASAFLAAKSTMPNRVSNVALAMWGTITHLRTDACQGSQWIFPKGKNSVPGLLYEGMLRADVRFTLDDVQASAPDPLLAQRLRERIRVDERAARGVDEHGVLLHLAQKARVYDVLRRITARREHEQHVALPRELVQPDAPDGPQGMARHERRFELVVARR